MKVLVVDDDLIVCEVAKERLMKAGHDVIVRDQALGTSRWIVDNKPDVVLLDVMMPALSGAELAAVLNRRGVDTAIILHSSKQLDELKKLVDQCGAAGAIGKTSNDGEFLKEFDRIVASSRKRAPA